MGTELVPAPTFTDAQINECPKWRLVRTVSGFGGRVEFNHPPFECG